MHYRWRHKQSMHCLVLRGILLVLFFGIADGVGLRAEDTEIAVPGKISSSQTFHPQPHAWEKYISRQNLFGLIVVTLMLSSICYGFVFTGLPENNLVELTIGWAELLSGSVPTTTIREENEEPDVETSMVNAPLTVVVKANAVGDDDPSHHVLSLEEKPTLTFDYSQLGEKNYRFFIDKTKVANLSYTVIIREGNIPVHFETIKADSLLNNGAKETSEIYGTKRAYFIDINNLPQNEVKLKNKILRIHYCIQK